MRIAVLGLGDSLSEYDPKDYDLAIGCNDIWKYHHTPVVVVLDHAKAFNSERLNTINNCKPEAFYSQIVEWDKRPDFKKIDILPGYPDRGLDLNKGIFKSFCSPFVSVQIAYRYYQADEIHLFGVDILNHPHLNGKLPMKIKGHFGHLKRALSEKGCRMIVHGSGILKDL